MQHLCLHGHKQQWLGRHAEQLASDALLTDLAPTPQAQARLRSASLPFGGGWLLAPPSTALDQRLPGRVFRLLLRFRLGMPLSPVALARCPCCQRAQRGTPVLDCYGTHAAMCHSGVGNSRRHNRVRDELCALLRKGDFTAEKEAPNLLMDDAGLRPADILVQRWERGLAACIDVSIVNPLAATYVARAAATAGHAAQLGEDKKRAKYGAHCAAARPPLILLPFVMETLGGVGKIAEGVLERIGDAISRSEGSAKAQALNFVGNRISFVCQRSLGMALAERYPLAGHDLDAPLQVVDPAPVFARPPRRLG